VTIENEGKSVPAQARQIMPEVILLDLYLSAVDGRDQTRELITQLETQHLPVILMSADTNIKEKVARRLPIPTYKNHLIY